MVHTSRKAAGTSADVSQQQVGVWTLAGAGGRPELAARYPRVAPFHPSERYPEAPFPGLSPEPNRVYGALRELFAGMGLDAARHGTPAWNPLGTLIRPGETVLLKPNLVRQSHQFNDDWEYVITHGSVIRAVADYAFLALQGHGRIIIADAPQTDSRLDLIAERLGFAELTEFYRRHGVDVEVVDLRNEFWIESDGIYVERIPLDGDPVGKPLVKLGHRSMFAAVSGRTYYGAYYDTRETNAHHSGGRHEYQFSGTALAADVVINLPKLKTHKKCGVTLSLKNLVGLNTNKNLLPHHSLGTPSQGGDQFSDESLIHRLENTLVGTAKRLLLSDSGAVKLLARKLKGTAYRAFGETHEVVRSGNWWGNDTIWRMVIDLNKILRFANPDGSLREDRPKRYLSVVDGIIGGEGNGPMAPDPRPVGLLAAGFNPAAVDWVCARLMGFDPDRIRHIRECFWQEDLPVATFGPEAIQLTANDPAICIERLLDRVGRFFAFEPHFGWKGHIEAAEATTERRQATDGVDSPPLRTVA
jgi:uncharacterized protein (DUF362 family)